MSKASPIFFVCIKNNPVKNAIMTALVKRGVCIEKSSFGNRYDGIFSSMQQ